MASGLGLNDFRKYRIANNAPDEVLKLTANNKDEAIKLVMEERMREFPVTLRLSLIHI